MSRTQGSSTAQSPAALTIDSGMATAGLAAKSPLGVATESGLVPSPDKDDNLVIKKIKTKHS